MSSTALESLGWDAAWAEAAARAGAPVEHVARVSAEQRGRWQVRDGRSEGPAVVARRSRASEAGDAGRPSVGDWVVLQRPLVAAAAGEPVAIEAVLPRRTSIARKAAGRAAREQVVAANVDLVLVVCALGRDVNERRIERFTAIAWNGGVTPEIVLNKSDLFDDDDTGAAAGYRDRVARAAPGVAIHMVSALTGAGMEALDPALATGRTVALLGTSGAGKSTLLNRWMLGPVAETGGLRADGKGRHTTTSRQLLVLPSGGMVIDTPGVREVGLWTGDEGVARTFEEVAALAAGCRFSDCRHETEPGCAVAAALAAGTVDPARVDSWRRLLSEQRHIDAQNDRAAAAQQKSAARSGARALQQRLRDKGRL